MRRRKNRIEKEEKKTGLRRRKKQDGKGEEKIRNEKKKKKNRIEKEEKKTGMRRRRKTGLRRRKKIGSRLRRHSRDIKTQEGHKDTGGTQRHRRDTKTQEGEITHRHFRRINGELTNLTKTKNERLPIDISGGLKGN